MLYKVKTAQILNDGTLKEGRRCCLFQTPKRLTVGGLYFLRPGKLYRVVELVLDHSKVPVGS